MQPEQHWRSGWNWNCRLIHWQIWSSLITMLNWICRHQMDSWRRNQALEVGRYLWISHNCINSQWILSNYWMRRRNWIWIRHRTTISWMGRLQMIRVFGLRHIIWIVRDRLRRQWYCYWWMGMIYIYWDYYWGIGRLRHCLIDWVMGLHYNWWMHYW